jgi:hypothetical protein
MDGPNKLVFYIAVSFKSLLRKNNLAYWAHMKVKYNPRSGGQSYKTLLVQIYLLYFVSYIFS